jgi:CRP/FNR family transcriptional regulator, nitrogen oxide reductase regulator
MFQPESGGSAGLAHLNRALIAGLPVFGGLCDADLDLVLEGARPFLVSKDSAIFEQDSEAQSFFLLLHGHVRVERTTPDGQKIIARYISEGELIGIAVALGRTTYPAAAIAAVDCTVLSWPNARWPVLSSRIPSLSGNVLKTVGKRMEDAQTRVVEMQTERVEQRVAHTILRLLRQTGRKVEEGVEIDFPISRQDIAEMTGTTLFTVSRVLSDWEGKGLIKSGRQKITVLQPHRLLVIAEGRN